MASIRTAGEGDSCAIFQLLESYGLRTEGVLAPATKYWVAEESIRVVGAIGLELGQTGVLLRSAIVDSTSRGRGVGRELTSTALRWAKEAGYGNAYCFSTDAGGYWTRLGFRACPVDEVVDNFQDAPQVRLFDRLGWLRTEAAYRIAL